MVTVKAWKAGEAGAPTFPEEYAVVKKAVLQVTDLKSNHNKYYALELHEAAGAKSRFRVYTHYGRTDDLQTNPNAGQKECRYFGDAASALSAYDKIYREKTSSRKGYREVALAACNIGSTKVRGNSSGEIDDQTLARIQGEDGKTPAAQPSKLATPVQRLVRYLYDEATHALTSAVAATITARGIETPLGILTLGQIEKGEIILAELYELFQNPRARLRQARMEELSGAFYTAIPHRIGRSRQAVQNAVIDSLEAFGQKQELLQLMKDMLQVNGEAGNVLFNAKIDQEYEALGCGIEWIDPAEPRHKELHDHVANSLVKSRSIKIKNLYSLRRGGEWESFTETVGNRRLMFHGSRIQNWVGILSRGILLPKLVASLGVKRTDAGWLGNGIYFGDAACTSMGYMSAGRQQTGFLALARVALGKMKEYRKITYGLSAPPDGFDSCHGVRGTLLKRSDFYDNEYVIYDTRQQKLEYLVEVAF